jgi:hypothetical protein
VLSHVYKVEAPLRHSGAKGERRYSSYSFLTSALDRVSGQRYASAAVYPGKMAPGTHWIGGWVGPRAGLDTEARGKIFESAGDQTPVVQFEVRHYTI